MRASQPAIAQDFRLVDCKHDRLRRALEFHPTVQSPVEVAAPLENSSAHRDDHKRTLVGAIGLFSLACGWFLCGSVASIDFSSFEGELTFESRPVVSRPFS